MSETKSERGLSLRRINYVMAAISLFVAFLFLLTARNLSARYSALRGVTSNYVELQKSAYELQAASDYLTEQVRSFAVTGERKYLDNYFHEANVTRRREHALDMLHTHVGGEAAYKELEHAMSESLELMETEYRSMRLTVMANGYDLSEYPEPVQAAALPDSISQMSSEEMLDEARTLVLNTYYFSKKEAISQSMDRCLSALVSEMEMRQSEAELHMHRLIMHLMVLVIVLFGINLLRILITSRLVVGPLLTGVLYIRDGQPLPIRGAYELRFLARTYNQMYEANREQTEQLAYEANHDKLTGAFNRSGYEHLLSKLNPKTCAMLLIDVDKFKTINDTYGHQVGDRALQRVAEELAANFRTGDHICRIGGDEFAILMPHTDKDTKRQIEQKIEKINNALQHPDSDLPPISLSVGCTFGSEVAESSSVDRDADVALYQVKEHGRCGIAFFEKKQ